MEERFEDLWSAGENPTKLINEYCRTKLPTMVKTSTRTRKGTASTPHNDDDETTLHSQSQPPNQMTLTKTSTRASP